MGSGHEELVHVELVEDVGVEVGPVLQPGADEQPERRRRSRRGVVAGLVGALVVGTAVVGVNVAERRALEERRAELAGLAGVLPGDLSRPMEDLWQIPGSWQTIVRTPADDLVGWSWDGTTSAIESETGEILWSLDPDHEGGRWCEPMGMTYEVTFGHGGVSTLYSPFSRPDTLLCTGDTGLETYDLQTGRRLASLAHLGGFATVGEDSDEVVALVPAADGLVEVVRWSARTGEVLWAAATGVRTETLDGEWGWGLDVTDDVVGLYGPEVLVFDATDGRRLEETALPSQPSGWPTGTLPDGASVSVEWGETSEVVAVREPDGTLRHRTVGTPLSASVRDAAATAVLLVRTPGGDLHAVDAVSGDVAWTRTDIVADVALVALDGRVVVLGDGVSRALDLQDGRTLWEHPTTAMTWPSAVTDGAHVLLAERREGERSNEIVVRRLDDGTEVRREPMPPGTMSFQVSGSLVLRQSGQGLFASRPSG